ncbi:MAG: family 20 glycosylhydrolase [Eubacterium sp.]|nr:family 20 glycosylhydrolase [Eubacterium sp.]
MKIFPIPKSIAYSDKRVELRDAEYINDDALEKEEYIIRIESSGTKIITSGKEGRFYAEQTLRQIKEQEVTACVIHDKPKYEYRGFMLDSVRHFIEVGEIKKLIDAMAFMKLNKFHWHLTDDQGWRIESEVYPQLNAASVRKYSDFGRSFDNNAYGGIYTKDEIKDVIAYCEERCIEVIPEFDIPGHTSALLFAFPELSCSGEAVEVKTHQGIFKDVLCPAKDKTLEVILNIYGEICELFTSDYIHIGGDEAPSNHWESCEDCKRKMSELGITSFKEYQNSLMNAVIGALSEKGKTCIVWNDAAEGKNLDSRAVVQYWKENDKATFDFANRGGKLILSPFTYYYTDYGYDITPLNRTVSFNPELKEISSDSVIGVEVPIWTEYISDSETLEKMLFPRAAAVANTAWSGATEYKRFLMSFGTCRKMLEKSGIRFADVWLWKNKRAAMPLGWLRFVKNNYSLNYIKEQLK